PGHQLPPCLATTNLAPSTFVDVHMTKHCFSLLCFRTSPSRPGQPEAPFSVLFFSQTSSSFFLYIQRIRHSICLWELGVMDTFSKDFLHALNSPQGSESFRERAVRGWQQRNTQPTPYGEPTSIPPLHHMRSSSNIERSTAMDRPAGDFLGVPRGRNREPGGSGEPRPRSESYRRYL